MEKDAVIFDYNVKALIDSGVLEYGMIVLGVIILFAFLGWFVKNFKLKHVWTVHLGLGFITAILIILFLHVNLSDGAMRDFLVGDTRSFSWPFTIQNAMWIVFSLTIWMLIAEGKLSKKDSVHEYKDLDAHIEGRIEPVRFLIWLIPTLGFLGTIVGMSFAIRELAESNDLLQSLENGMIQSVMTNLGTAFYTTILGLIMNAICYGVMSIHVFKHKQVLAEGR